MLKYLCILFFFDVSIGQMTLSPTSAPYYPPFFNPHPLLGIRPGSANQPLTTHLRIRQEKDHTNQPSATPFASPTNEYYGGSVYSNGDHRVLLRPNDDFSSQNFIHLNNNNNNWDNSYQPYVYGSYVPYSLVPYVYKNNGRFSSASKYDRYSPVPTLMNYDYYPYSYYPQNEFNGLGRVQPVQQPRGSINGLGRVLNKDQNQQILFFTLGRIMGQLKKISNETNTNAIFERFFGNQQVPVGSSGNPSYTWQIPGPYSPWGMVNPWFMSPNGHFLQQQRQSSAFRPSLPWWHFLSPFFQDSSKQASGQ